MRDWSKVHTPSKAYEQPSIKEEIEKLKKMSPYLDKDENVINEDYIIMRLKITSKVKEWQKANPEEVVKSPDVTLPKVIEKNKKERKELTQYAIDAPARYMEYETKNGADSNLLLHSLIVKWEE